VPKVKVKMSLLACRANCHIARIDEPVAAEVAGDAVVLAERDREDGVRHEDLGSTPSTFITF